MICVMGANGQLGRRVVHHLLAGGVAPAQVVGVGRGAVVQDPGDAAIVARTGDYTDRSGLERAYAGVDTLILIPTKSAAAPRVQEHDNALTAARAAGVRRVLFLSNSSATPSSKTLVAPFALYAESATRLSGMAWVLLRMGLYLEPLAEWAPQLAAMGRLPYPVSPEARVAYVSREDIARATAAAAIGADRGEVAGRIYELAGAAAPTMTDVAASLSRATGRPIRFDRITDAEYMRLCEEDGTPAHLNDILLSLYHGIEAGEFATPSDDVERLTGTAAESADAFFARTLSPR